MENKPAVAHTTNNRDTQVSRTLPDNSDALDAASLKRFQIEHNNGGIYAIIDSKAEAVIGPLMIARHEAQAVRNFCDVADDQKGWIYKHPEDYDLYRLGWLTTENQLIAEHQLILSGSSYRATKPDNQT